MSFTKLLCFVMSSILKILKKGNYKHQKLLEDWEQSKEPLLEGLTFYVKYLGSCLVERSNGERTTAEAVKSIVGLAKLGGKKLERVSLSVTPKSILVINIITKEHLFEVPINRISYCSADAHYNHVFAFIQSNKNDIMECNAFLCSKRKMAQAVTLTISQAFNVAYDLWLSSKTEHKPVEDENMESSQMLPCEVKTNETKEELINPQEQVLLIDLNYEEKDKSPTLIFQENSSDYFWESNFAEFSKNTNFCTLKSSLADTPIAQFVVNPTTSELKDEFFLDDTEDLLLL